MARRLVIICILAMLCSSCGPRMRNQVSVKPYKERMPTMPVGTVPTTGRLVTTTLAGSSGGAAPIAPTRTMLRDGKTYYGYYCLMCHGEKGDGNGPVGESYVPKPTDLTSPTVAGLSDGQLLSGMLHGVGHDPVMDQTVLPHYRPQLLAYVRSLARTRR